MFNKKRLMVSVLTVITTFAAVGTVNVFAAEENKPVIEAKSDEAVTEDEDEIDPGFSVDTNKPSKKEQTDKKNSNNGKHNGWFNIVNKVLGITSEVVDEALDIAKDDVTEDLDAAENIGDAAIDLGESITDEVLKYEGSKKAQRWVDFGFGVAKKYFHFGMDVANKAVEHNWDCTEEEITGEQVETNVIEREFKKDFKSAYDRIVMFGMQKRR